MTKTFRTKLFNSLALALVLSLIMPWTAFADSLVADGDGVTAVANNNDDANYTLRFGNVCANSTVEKPVNVAVKATGHPGSGNNTFANNAVLAVVASTASAGLSTTNGTSITLPSNWTTQPNQTLSGTSSPSVTVRTGSAGSTISGSFTVSVSGTKSNGGTLTKSTSFGVSGTVISCAAADTTAPSLSLPANITQEATSSSGAAVTYTATATDANPASPTVSCTPASGSTFALGTTTVTCSATDAAGNTARGSFTVTVRDTTGPTISDVPANITREATGPSGATASYATPTASDRVSGTVAVSCNPASGSTFALGTTTVTCSAADAAGNSSSATFTVTVRDTTGPSLTLSNVTAEATSSSGATVTYSASASDLVDGVVAISCNPASGSIFALGTTTVNCSAADSRGNSNSGSFDILVQDTTAPVLSLPTSITAEATGPAGAAVNYSASANDAVDGSVTPDCSPTSGSTFALGSATVNCEATDAAGNKATGSFTVTVQDTTPPVLTLANEVAEATGPFGAVVSYSASASDLVSGTVAVTCSAASGSTFALGTTTVTCSAADAAGNTARGSFTVTVQDTTAPSISDVPVIGPVEATGPSGAAVTYTAPTASDLVSGSVAVSCSPASGSTFALGTTTVTCSAADAAGNSASTTFTVTVRDTTAPVLTLTADLKAMATSTAGAAVTYTAPTATDLVSGSVTVSCSPASGSTFAIGQTTVNCEATDAAGNKATGSFIITVTYNFSGFYQPIDTTTTSTIVWNTIQNGRTVPIKFEVFAGATEITNTSIVVQPLKVTRINCVSGNTDAIEDLTATGSTSLRYDATGGQFIYNWQTPKQANTCYAVTISLTEGSSRIAYFNLK